MPSRVPGSVLLVSSDRVVEGVRERRFDVVHVGRRIPGMLWTPPGGDSPLPLVLLGHGGSGSKHQDHVVAAARELVNHHAMAACAIDGPVHGDRRPDPDAPAGLVLAQFAQLWANDGWRMTDDAVDDWRAVLDAVSALPDVGTGPVGWWGVSLGTILGLPFVAAEPRIAAAVLGLMGLAGPTRDRIERDAPSVRCPVLFLVQWDDELFARADALALFSALGSPDRRLHAYVGGHGDLPVEAFKASWQFLAERLAVPGRGQQDTDAARPARNHT